MRSDIHNEIQDNVKKHCSNMGLIAVKEQYICGKKIDVLAQNILTKFTIAYEIQLSPKHSIENVLLDLKAGCDEVRIVSINERVSKQIKEKISKKLSKDLLKKIEFHVADEFIPPLVNNNKQQNKAELNPEINME